MPNDDQHALPQDRFFILRDCRALFERHLEEIVRHCNTPAHPLSTEAVAAFCREAGEAHDELVAAREREGFEQTDGLTASRISLLGEDDLELDIRIGDLIARARDRVGEELWQAQSRYMSLLNRPYMTAEAAPCGLEAVRCAVWVLSRATPRPLDTTMALLDRLDVVLQEKLPALYAGLDALLAERGIEAAQAQVIKANDSRSPSAGTANAPVPTAGTADASASLQQTLAARHSMVALKSGTRSAAHTTGPAGDNAANNAATLLMLSQLQERLAVLEASHTGEMTTAPPRALGAGDVNLPPDSPAGIAIDTLSLIFSHILESEDLAEPVKSLLSQFQIPLLKIAITDNSFFSNPQHPGRCVVNRIARAAIGLPAEAARDHPVCQHLAPIVSAAREAMDADDPALDAALQRIDAFITERDSTTLSTARAYLLLTAEHEAQHIAHQAASLWLQSRLSRATHPSIQSFLKDFWLRIMQAAHQKSGLTGSDWRAADSVIEELLWSLSPKHSPEDKKKLVALIPALLQRINAGLDQLAVPAGDRKPFMDACFQLQTAAMRGATEAADIPAAAPVPPPPVQASHEILEHQGKLVQVFLAGSGQPMSGRLADVGEWLTFRLPDANDPALCGLLSGYTPSGKTALLFNPDWGYAVALPAAALAQQLQTGHAALVSNAALFDRAADHALRKLTGS